jgi:acyl carrier protein
MSARQQEFVGQMTAWLNDEVAPQGVVVDAGTPLFATRLLDSLKVLELIAFTEQAIGRMIPDCDIRMDNFQTVARIAAVFLPLDVNVAA